jgi:hypothetical protein
MNEYEDDFYIPCKGNMLEQCKAKQVSYNLDTLCHTTYFRKPTKISIGDYIPLENKLFMSLPKKLATRRSIKDILKTLSEAAAKKGLKVENMSVLNIHYLPVPKTCDSQRVSCIVDLSSTIAITACLKVKNCLKKYVPKDNYILQENEDNIWEHISIHKFCGIKNLTKHKLLLGGDTSCDNKLLLILPKSLVNDESINKIAEILFEVASKDGLKIGDIVDKHYLIRNAKRVSCIVTLSSKEEVNACLKVKSDFKQRIQETMQTNNSQQQQKEHIFIDKHRTKEELASYRALREQR